MLDREEIDSIRIYTQKAERDKAFQSLDGLLEGITADSVVTSQERDELLNWYNIHRWLFDKHPYNEILPCLQQVGSDSLPSLEAIADLRWLVHQVSSDHMYYDVITADIQRLEGMLHGFLSDNDVSDAEIQRLENWLAANQHLEGIYPYDEICAILAGILRDGIVTDVERNYLSIFMSEFVNRSNSACIDFDAIDALKQHITIEGICAVNPRIEFDGCLYCFTGAAQLVKRKDFAEIVEHRGGAFNNDVLSNTDYLVVGNKGNPCWAYACYGRKVEKAIDLRRHGAQIQIVNELDFWKAIL